MTQKKPTTKLALDPTDWDDTSTKEKAPPANVLLLVLTSPKSELGLVLDVAIPYIGYWSADYSVFLDAQNVACLNELHEIIAYHVITDLNGKTIPVFVPDLESIEA